MTRTAWALVLLLAIGIVAAGNYFGAARIQSAANEQVPSGSLPGVTAEPLLHPAQADVEQSTSANGGEVNTAVESDPFAKLLAAIDSDDADSRTAAVRALAEMPRQKAIPVLQKVLNSGADEDRQLAIDSLHTMALQQGDADGEIRNVLRLTIYDGGDEAIVANAQILLDAIEHRTTRAASR